jgi:hypothetical protein
MIIMFLKSLIKKIKKIRIIRQTDIKIDFLLKGYLEQERKKQSHLYRSNTSSCNYQTLTEEDNSIVDVSNKEATNFYEFYRILSQDNYELGKSVRDFIDNFKQKYKNINESYQSMPNQMKEICNFIDECVDTFYCYFNFGKTNTEKLLPYCRPAVESFIFNKLYFIIYELYNKKYEEENKVFTEKKTSIKENNSIETIMKYLELREDYRGINKDFDFSIPYRSTIDCINKIEYEITPKDKLDTLMKASLELRNCILDITKGKVII